MLECEEIVAVQERVFLVTIIAEIFKRFKITETSIMLDRMKELRI